MLAKEMNPGKTPIKSALDKRVFAKNNYDRQKLAVDGFNANGVRVLSTSAVARKSCSDLNLNFLQANILQSSVENRHTGVEILYT